jgi:hypothetical protein
MKLVDWFLSDAKFKTHVIHVPTKLNHALEAFSYINEVETEEVILYALNVYLRDNLWSVKQKDNRAIISRPKQLRD